MGGKKRHFTFRVMFSWVSQMALVVKKPPVNAGDLGMWVRSLGQADPLEEGMATHFDILSWRTPMDRGAWQATVHRVAKSWT